MSFMDQLGEAGKTIMGKGKELGKVAKLKLEIASIESGISDQKKKIGDIIVKEKIDVKNPEVKEIMQKIEAMYKDIEEKNEEIKTAEI